MMTYSQIGRLECKCWEVAYGSDTHSAVVGAGIHGGDIDGATRMAEQMMPQSMVRHWTGRRQELPHPSASPDHSAGRKHAYLELKQRAESKWKIRTCFCLWFCDMDTIDGEDETCGEVSYIITCVATCTAACSPETKPTKHSNELQGYNLNEICIPGLYAYLDQSAVRPLLAGDRSGIVSKGDSKLYASHNMSRE